MKIIFFLLSIIVLPGVYAFTNDFDIDLKLLDKGSYKLTYEEHYFRGIGESYLTIRKTPTGYVAVWEGINDTTRIFTDSAFNTEKMVFTDQDTKLEVTRTEDSLEVTGFDKGSDIRKVIKINQDQWYQILGFSIMKFTLSKKTAMSFALFDPYNIKIVNVKIEKVDNVPVLIDNKEYQGVKMSMRLKGILSPFWKAEIWNDSVTGIYLRYEGINIIPKLYKARIFLKKAEFIHY